MSTPPDLGPLPETGRVVSEPPSFYKDKWKHNNLYTAAQIKAERERCYMLGIAAERERQLREQLLTLAAVATPLPSAPTKEGG